MESKLKPGMKVLVTKPVAGMDGWYADGDYIRKDGEVPWKCADKDAADMDEYDGKTVMLDEGDPDGDWYVVDNNGYWSFSESWLTPAADEAEA